jgi:hypothetical protein
MPTSEAIIEVTDANFADEVEKGEVLESMADLQVLRASPGQGPRALLVEARWGPLATIWR